jgi:ABC-type multidrug transport system fused ATPase/permease subunit
MTSGRSTDGHSPAPNSSSRARLHALLGDRYQSVVTLALSSMLAGFAEAGILVLLAQIAATLVDKHKWVTFSAGVVHLHTHVATLFLVAAALGVLRLALQAPLSILPARIAADVQARLRKDLFGAFTRASWAVQSSDREGHMQETMTSQVIQATGGALQATTLLSTLITFLVLMISALALNVVAAGVILGAALVLFAALRPLNRLGARRSRQLSAAQMEYAGGIGESVRVAEETQVFGVAEAQRRRMDGLIDAARDLFYRTQLIGRLVPNLYQSLMYLLIVGGLAALYAVSSRHVASLAGVILLLVRAGSNGQQIQGSYQSLRQSLPFIERLQEAAQRYSQSTPVTGRRPLASVRRLAFERVSFSYRPGQPVLRDIDFEVAGGEAIGVIGPSGAGKSTLVQLLLQLRAPERGRFLVNRLPAPEIAREDWHKRVAYVPQEPRLVHASVAENIRYFRAGIDDQAVERAARLARIHDDIAGWADGYRTIVGPRADAVSGGQQQRICLARALAAQPQVLVLDEPTSALDPQSEMLIQESLLTLKGELTLFIIAHRMSTLDVCDRVMVILDGRLSAFETTERLRSENAYYRSALGLAAGVPTGQVALTSMSNGHAPAEATRPAEGFDVDCNGLNIVPAPLGASDRERERVARSAVRAPDFFIAGQPKSGTTALYEMLRRHPQIYLPDRKEPRFFASEMYLRDPPRPGGTPQTLEEYLSWFDGAAPEQRIGDASPWYLWSRTAAARIAEACPDARIVAILRDPASLLRSLHLEFVQLYVEVETDLRRALALEEPRRQGRQVPRNTYWPNALMYSDHVRTVEQLRRFHAHFPLEQVLVLIYDDFRGENEATVRRVLRFLGVDDSLAIEVTDANPTVTVRSRRLHELTHAMSVGHGPVSRAVKSSVKALTPRELRRDALRTVQNRLVFAAAAPPEERVMHELRRRFKGEVVALSEYLDRDLVTLWGYDGVDARA